MESHLARNISRRSKRHSNMNELFLSPSLHHIHQRKQPRLIKQKALNQNRSRSSRHAHERLQTKSIYSSSYTSLNSYLKEFNLSEKDFFELRQALQTIFHYLQPQIIYNQNQLLKQRLTSPYTKQQLDNDDQSLLPLYTNEYFIRNGLLNHNDGPDFHSINLCYSNPSKPLTHLSSCYTSLSSSVNISLPLTLLSNQKYLFTALTSNFTSEKSRRSQSNLELNVSKYHGDEDESESVMIRRNKVQTWERENILQQKNSITYSSIQQNDQFQASEYHRSSAIRTPSTTKENSTMKITEESSGKNSTSLRTCSNEEGNKNTDDLFPMVKVLAPYIIFRDLNNNRSNSIPSTDIHIRNNGKSVQHDTPSEKQFLMNTLNPALITSEQQSLFFPSSCTINQTAQQEQQRKKNYLLAEFESVLTQISKKQFL